MSVIYWNLSRLGVFLKELAKLWVKAARRARSPSQAPLKVEILHVHSSWTLNYHDDISNSVLTAQPSPCPSHTSTSISSGVATQRGASTAKAPLVSTVHTGHPLTTQESKWAEDHSHVLPASLEPGAACPAPTPIVPK